MNVGVFLLLLACLLLGACDPNNKQWVLGGPTMGTTWSVKLVNSNKNISADELRETIQTVLNTIEQQMSTWKPDSDVSLFNQGGKGCFDVSIHTKTVVEHALSLSKKSHGAFDVTISPLIKRWGFGKDFTGDSIPSSDEIEALKQAVGYQKIYFDGEQLCKLNRDVTINLSAIAKGYAVDKVADALQQLNISDYLVEVGGELYAHGMSPRGRNWAIGVEKPITDGREIMENIAIALVDKGLATSGDYRIFFEREGKRYSHIIDPVTGSPVTHQLASVTVLADTSMLADAWATGLLVMGAEQALKIAEEERLAVLLLEYADNGGFNHYTSQYWPY